MHIQHVTHVFKSDMLKRHIADAYASHLEYTHDHAYATCRVIRVAGPSIYRGIRNIICVTSYVCTHDNAYATYDVTHMCYIICVHESLYRNRYK